MIKAIEQSFREKVSAKIHMLAEGVDRFLVFTPFMFEDGDHLVVVLKKEGAQWVLTDEAHTYMHLACEIEEEGLHKGAGQSMISDALASHRVRDRDGELVLDVPDERFGDALHSFVQALLTVSDMAHQSRARAHSTCIEDSRSLLSPAAPQKPTLD